MLASLRARSREIIAEGRAWLLGNLHRSHFINTFDCLELNYIVLSPIAPHPLHLMKTLSWKLSPTCSLHNEHFSAQESEIISRVSSLCPLYIPEHWWPPKANSILMTHKLSCMDKLCLQSVCSCGNLTPKMPKTLWFNWCIRLIIWSEMLFRALNKLHILLSLY